MLILFKYSKESKGVIKVSAAEKLGSNPEQMNNELFAIADIIVGSSEGRIRIAHNEQNETTEFQAEAAHFLKLDENRLGRDLELYGFISRLENNEFALLTFLEEVVLPLRDTVPNSYEVASAETEKIGLKIFSVENRVAWSAIFAEPELT